MIITGSYRGAKDLEYPPKAISPKNLVTKVKFQQ